jgi:hypothetical protein
MTKRQHVSLASSELLALLVEQPNAQLLARMLSHGHSSTHAMDPHP